MKMNQMTQMSENTNTQISAPHRLLNSSLFIRKINQMTQMSENINAQNLVPLNIFKFFKIRHFLPIQMSKNFNAQNPASHYLLNSSQFVCKINKMTQTTQITQMSENTNAQNSTPHCLLNLARFGISCRFENSKVTWLCSM